MGFPPVSNLLNVTFEQLAPKFSYKMPESPPQAPQPVANAQGIDAKAEEGVGVASGAKSPTNRVGTVLDVTA